jgi:hypothetical protein
MTADTSFGPIVRVSSWFFYILTNYLCLYRSLGDSLLWTTSFISQLPAYRCGPHIWTPRSILHCTPASPSLQPSTTSFFRRLPASWTTTAVVPVSEHPARCSTVHLPPQALGDSLPHGLRLLAMVPIFEHPIDSIHSRRKVTAAGVRKVLHTQTRNKAGCRGARIDNLPPVSWIFKCIAKICHKICQLPTSSDQDWLETIESWLVSGFCFRNIPIAYRHLCACCDGWQTSPRRESNSNITSPLLTFDQTLHMFVLSTSILYISIR